jgi:pyruvate kinase
MSRLRCPIPMIAFTPSEDTRRRMALTWGIESFEARRVTHTDEMFPLVDQILLDQGLVQVGDKVVVISGSPPGTAGTTNDLRVHVIGQVESVASS